MSNLRGVMVTGDLSELRCVLKFAAKLAGVLTAAVGGRLALISVGPGGLDASVLPEWTAEAWKSGRLVEIDFESRDGSAEWILLIDAPRYAALAVALAVTGYAYEDGLNLYTYIDGVDCPVAVSAAGLCSAE